MSPMHPVPSPALPAVDGEPVSLRDGRAALIRPIRPPDKERLRDEFAHLGEDSRRFRFLGTVKQLSQGDLAKLSEVDHHDHEALIATTLDGAQAVGAARYIRPAHDAADAELAIEVVDEWQRCGLGSALLTHLAVRAAADGVHAFTALCLAENHAILRMLERLGPTRVAVDGPGTVTVRTSLEGWAEHDRDAA
jgi:GNAT superfamily N-acetyltransferase